MLLSGVYFSIAYRTAIYTRSSATAEIARVGGHYIVHVHSRSPTENGKFVHDFTLANNNLHLISHRLPLIAQYLSNYRL